MHVSLSFGTERETTCMIYFDDPDDFFYTIFLATATAASVWVPYD